MGKDIEQIIDRNDHQIKENGQSYASIKSSFSFNSEAQCGRCTKLDDKVVNKIMEGIMHGLTLTFSLSHRGPPPQTSFVVEEEKSSDEEKTGLGSVTNRAKKNLKAMDRTRS